MSNRLDPDQARHFVGSDLGLICLQKLSGDDELKFKYDYAMVYFRAVQHKIENVTTAIEKLGKMTKGLKVALKNAQMMTEVEDLVCLFV